MLDQLLANDLDLPVAERHSLSRFLGLRPWKHSSFAKPRRGPRQKFF